MSTADDIRADLADAGAARVDHRQGARVQMLQIERLVREGAEAGIGPSEMARLAQVSRQTINNILNQPPKDS
jgi:hypothetical protein